MRPKGTPNGTGEIKDVVIKFRASREFADLMKMVKNGRFFKPKNLSAMYRKLIFFLRCADADIMEEVKEQLSKRDRI